MDNDDSQERTVADLVRGVMAERRVSGVALAARLGVTQPYLSRRLTGEVEFRAGELERIAAELGVPVSRFFADEVRAA